MQNREQKVKLEDLYQLLDQHVVYASLDNGNLSVTFENEDSKSQFAEKFKSFLQPAGIDVFNGIQSILLKAAHQKMLWGEEAISHIAMFYSQNHPNIDQLTPLLPLSVILEFNPSLFQLLIRTDSSINAGVNPSGDRLYYLQPQAFGDRLHYLQAQECLDLIEHMSVASINYTLRGEASYNTNTLAAAAMYQTEKVFIALIKKASPVELAIAATVIRRDFYCPFEYISQYQTPAAFQVFIEHLAQREAKAVISRCLTFDNLVSLFLNIALYQTAENCALFLGLLDTKQLVNLFIRIQSKINTDHSTRFALRALQYKLEQHGNVLPSHEIKSKNSWENLERISFHVQFIDLDIEYDKTVIKDFQLKILLLLQKYDQMEYADKKKSFLCSEREEKALSQFAEGPFVKIVRENHDLEFVKHLFDPTQRQTLRDPLAKNERYKLMLNPNTTNVKEEKAPETERNDYLETIRERIESAEIDIFLARSDEEQAIHKNQKERYTHTKKTPVTFVSKNMNTGLFGFHANREMVGYAFTVKQKNIKLLSTQDCGTFHRWWRSGKAKNLIKQSKFASKIICKNFAEFTQRVDQRPYVVNEALVKLSKDDLFAIIIAKDTSAARKIAITRRNAILEDHKIDLPILFYNPEQRRVTAYTSTEQRHDYPDLCLKRLKQQIIFQDSAGIRPIRISFDAQDYTLSATTAKTILSIIEEKSASSENIFLRILGKNFGRIISLLRPFQEYKERGELGEVKREHLDDKKIEEKSKHDFSIFSAEQNQRDKEQAIKMDAINSIFEIIKDHRDGSRLKEKRITPHVKENVAEVINRVAATLLTRPEHHSLEKNIARNKMLLLEQAFQELKKIKQKIFIRQDNDYALSCFFTPRVDAVSATEQKHIKILKELYLAALKQFAQSQNFDEQDVKILQTARNSELLAYHRSYYQMFCGGRTRSSQIADALIKRYYRL